MPRMLRRSNARPVRPARGTAAALAALLVVALTGCSQGASSTLQQALKDGSSATVSASQAMGLLAAGRSTDALTESTLEDMLGQLNSAQSSVANASTDTNADRRARQRVRSALDEAVAVVTQGEDAVSGTPGAPSAATVARRLDRITARLSALQRAGGTA
jgi:hypothetical protein